MEQITLDMIPNSRTPIAHISQYDSGRHIRFNLQNITLTGSETVTLKIRKPDGELVSKTIENHTSYVEYVSEKADCDVSGKANCEIVISKDDVVIGSKNFIMEVEADAYDGANVVTKTASGKIATFETNIADVLQSLKCDITAKQDLHGYDHPWSAGGGKNKLPPCSISGDSSVTITSDNGKYTLSGTATGYNQYIASNTFTLAKGTYTLKNFGNTDSEVHFQIRSVDGLVTYADSILSASTFTLSEDTELKARITLNHSGSYTYSEVLTPQIEVGSTATAYEPYSNICPIVGHSELNIDIGINNFLNETTFSQGSIDAATGEELASPYRVRTDFIWLEEGNYLISSPNGFDIVADIYDENKSYKLSESYPTWISTPRKISILSGGRYARVLFRKPDNSSITPSEISGELLTKILNIFIVAFGQTVYGGVYDKSGRMPITHGYVDLGTCTWGGGSDIGGKNLFTVAIPDIKRPDTTSTLPNWKIEGYELKTQVEAVNYNNVYSGLGWFDGVAFWTTDYTASQRDQLKADMSGIHLVYELATPIVIDVPSISVFAENGTNNVFSDTGDTEVKYLYKA